MTPPTGRVYRSGDDPRIEHPDPQAGPAAPGPSASGPDEPTAVTSGTYLSSARPEPPVPEPTSAGAGLYRSSSSPLAESEATGLLAPVNTPVGDPAATGVLPEVGGDDAAGADGGRASLFRNSAVMAGFTILSRIIGYLRTAVMGVALGGEAVSNAYTNGQYSPLMIYELLLGGTLSSVLVPLLVRARKSDPDQGQAYAQRFATMAAVLLAGATVLVTICAPLIALAVAGNRNHGLVTAFSYIMLPAIFFYGFSALFQAILNTRGSFAAPTWAPMLNNLVVIGAFSMFHFLWSDKPTVDSMTGPRVLLLGLGFTLGIAVQAAVLWPALRKVGFRWKFRFDFRKLGLGRIARLGGWAMCYVTISQIGLTAVIHIANAAAVGPHDPGPTVYDNAYLLMMMANGIAAVSVMTAIMPRMSAAAADHRYSDVADYLSLGTRMSSVLLVPATAGFLAFGAQLGVLLFQYGNYSHQTALDTGFAITLAGLGLLPFAISQMQIFAFYAMPDTRTPAVINIPVVAAKVIFDLLVLAVVPHQHVVPFLLLGNAISFAVAAVVSYALLRRRIGALGLRRVGSMLTRLIVAAAVAGLVAFGVARVLTAVLGRSHLGSLVELAGGGVVLTVVYFALAYLLRVREVNEVVGMVRRRLGR
jgi:putative peptidoglycan lipid II flippase